ncbi:MAG: hypothetical protein KatS3mg102_0578 [Planctomycetota bacterium]|nr:MAG: hypothetical protein KatS3mg102_0578 [Planctomycetota bacterium]
MEGISCDRCGRSLLVDDDVRYVVEIRVYAAYDPLEVTRQDLEQAGDPRQWDRLLAAIRARTAEQLQDEVYRELRFDLCPRCQRDYLQQPLPAPAAEDGPDAEHQPRA